MGKPTYGGIQRSPARVVTLSTVGRALAKQPLPYLSMTIELCFCKIKKLVGFVIYLAK